MATDPIPDNATPSQPFSPEDDAALQAIEALEARSIDPDPEPYIPRVAPRPVISAAPVIIEPTPVKPVPQTPPPTPRVMEPIIAKTAVAAAQAVVKHTIPTPATAPSPAPTQAPSEPPKPKVHKTPAVEIAEELANAPPTLPGDAPFQPFSRQKPSKKSLLIIVGVILILGLIAGGYFGWQSLHSS